MNDTKQKLITAIFIAFAFGAVGAMDAEDEKGQQDNYCQMVADGLWPEYREGDIDCEGL